MAEASVSPHAERIELFGLPVDAMRRSAFERRIVAHLGDPSSGFWHVATVNPEYVVAARRDPAFSRALVRADLVSPDGVGITLASRCLCNRRLTRFTGVDLCEMLFTAEFPVAPRIFLLGSPDSVAELQGRHPTRIVGRWGDGSSSPVDDTESVRRIHERNANVVLVGYGSPGQVLWIERNRLALSKAGVKLAIGVGGALDFAAGTVERAPAPMRRLGLEWAYRLAREPWRWRRQLALPIFAQMVGTAWARERLLGDGGACRLLSHDDEAN